MIQTLDVLIWGPALAAFYLVLALRFDRHFRRRFPEFKLHLSDAAVLYGLCLWMALGIVRIYIDRVEHGHEGEESTALFYVVALSVPIIAFIVKCIRSSNLVFGLIWLAVMTPAIILAAGLMQIILVPAVMLFVGLLTGVALIGSILPIKSNRKRRDERYYR